MVDKDLQTIPHPRPFRIQVPHLGSSSEVQHLSKELVWSLLTVSRNSTWQETELPRQLTLFDFLCLLILPEGLSSALPPIVAPKDAVKNTGPSPPHSTQLNAWNDVFIPRLKTHFSHPTNSL